MPDHASATFAHHFASAEQQHSAANLGMWVFIVQEVMFFGGLFMAYIAYRFLFHDAFIAANHHLNVTLGAVNTVVLILSSLTMALAVRGAQTSNKKALITFLILTLILGSTFLGIKVVEYSDKFEHHLVPGPHFQFEAVHARGAEIFYSLYFAMTGMHALHMIIGGGLMIWLLVGAFRNRFSAHYFSPVENCGLYWHFVDIVWIFLFPFLYLIGHQ